MDQENQGLSIGLMKWEKRSIEEPVAESVLRGLREGFIETISTNTSLLRRKLKSPHLKIRSMTIGTYFLPAFVALFLFIILAIIPELNPLYMLPIMEGGILPSVAGAGVLQAWYSEFLILSFLLPFVANREKVMKSTLISLFAVILTMVISNLATLLLMGELTGNYTYPFLLLARYISLADFFTHLESLYMAIWVLGAFVKTSIFYYVSVLGTAQWLNLCDYRPIVFPLGFLLTLLSIWVAPNLQELNRAIGTTVTLSMMTLFVAFPVLLFCLAWVKKRLSGNMC